MERTIVRSRAAVAIRGGDCHVLQVCACAAHPKYRGSHARPPTSDFLWNPYDTVVTVMNTNRY
jgi:hypothetical protein